MSDRMSLMEELQNLVSRLFQTPRAWGKVTDTEDGPIIHRIGAIRNLLAERDG